MCGIYVFAGINPIEKVFEGLKRLDYRGYDSWGIVGSNGSKLLRHRKVGKISKKLPNKIAAFMALSGVGHTRWATHGKVSVINAHPHFSTNKTFAVVHNGIVENFDELRSELIATGVKFYTETDTEIIVKLIENYLANNLNVWEVLSKIQRKLEGRNSYVVIDTKGLIFGARNGSPLVLGQREKDGSVVLSSDVVSLSDDADEFMTIDNGTGFVIKNGEIELHEIDSGSKMSINYEPIISQDNTENASEYRDYFLKEVFETPRAIVEVSKIDETYLAALSVLVKKVDTLAVVGSGTAGVAASLTANYLTKSAGKIAHSLTGADANWILPYLTSNSLVLALSQSGETADVMQFLEMVKIKGARIASYVNMPGSMMSKISDHALMANAGPEKCVLSTKVFCSQVAFGYLLSKSVGGELEEAKDNLVAMATIMGEWLDDNKNKLRIRKVESLLREQRDVYIMGVGNAYGYAYEGMIKLIEGTYIHAHAIPAGDLKHFAITLIEPGTVVIVITSSKLDFKRIRVAVKEVQARGAYVIGVGNENPGSDFFLKVPYPTDDLYLPVILPLQMLTHAMAIERGIDIDKPRNIAKSVTVI